MTKSKASMESLPAELLLMLLQTLDYAGLRALVHAFPAAHDVYLMARDVIFTSVSQTTVPPSTANTYPQFRPLSIH